MTSMHITLMISFRLLKLPRPHHFVGLKKCNTFTITYYKKLKLAVPKISFNWTVELARCAERHRDPSVHIEITRLYIN